MKNPNVTTTNYSVSGSVYSINGANCSKQEFEKSSGMTTEKLNSIFTNFFKQ